MLKVDERSCTFQSVCEQKEFNETSAVRRYDVNRADEDEGVLGKNKWLCVNAEMNKSEFEYMIVSEKCDAHCSAVAEDYEHAKATQLVERGMEYVSKDAKLCVPNQNKWESE